jgi:hypothetical protein
MFVINNPNGTHLWYIQFTKRKNLIDLPYLDDQFLFLKHIKNYIWYIDTLMKNLLNFENFVKSEKGGSKKNFILCGLN